MHSYRWRNLHHIKRHLHCNTKPLWCHSHRLPSYCLFCLAIVARWASAWAHLLAHSFARGSYSDFESSSQTTRSLRYTTWKLITLTLTSYSSHLISNIRAIRYKEFKSNSSKSLGRCEQCNVAVTRLDLGAAHQTVEPSIHFRSNDFRTVPSEFNLLQWPEWGVTIGVARIYLQIGSEHKLARACGLTVGELVEEHTRTDLAIIQQIDACT